MNRCRFLWRSKTVSEDLWLAQMSVSLLWEGVDAVPGSWVLLSGVVPSAIPTLPIHSGLHGGSASSRTNH